jgi:hypothetical protein
MPRRLTSEEVDREVRDITTRPWPNNPTLPVKNLYDGRVGSIFRRHDGGPETIVPEVVTVLRTLTFPSLQVMVEAGWVVD